MYCIQVCTTTIAAQTHIHYSHSSSPAHQPVHHVYDGSYSLKVASSFPSRPRGHCDRSHKDQTGRIPLTQSTRKMTRLRANTSDVLLWYNCGGCTVKNDLIYTHTNTDVIRSLLQSTVVCMMLI